MDFLLEDLAVQYSGVSFSLSIEKKLSSSLDVLLSLNFGKAFPKITQRLTLTMNDIRVLKEQIDNLSQPSGGISLIEPEFYIRYNRYMEGSIELFVVIDAGFANSNMGADSGPALRMMTTEEELKNWIDKITQYLN